MFEATRFATGRKNAMRIEVNGSLGSLAFDFESMNELRLLRRAEDARTAGFRRILVTEPRIRTWTPGGRPGHIIGYEHTFTHQVRDFVTAIADGMEPRPSFADGLQVQRCWTPSSQRPGRRPHTQSRAFQLRRPAMARPVTLFTGQWADLPFTEVCRLAVRLGLRRPGGRHLGRPLRRRRPP